ncbi:MAG: phosphoribosylformylglycinamidine cyclo-ligase, partial [Desulfobacterales bacterium]|nr:phosphoribosylformylglycinamidine cyclo-ligase [Desulfobacterales bacterium]
MTERTTYADAGVDIEKANTLVGAISRITKQTKRPGVISEIGGFAGLFSIQRHIADMQHPVLVSSTDGVGTKLKVAFMMDKHDTIGIDLVAMCVNDILVQGATPLFLLDYLAVGKLDPGRAEAIITGVAEGCKQAKCALIGGETAEMPGMYPEGEYDLAGFVVGIVDNARIIDGTSIRAGHQLIGIASSGLHSNGFSLVRRICFDLLKLKVDAHVPELGRTLGEELITPTRIYTETVQALMKDLPVHGLAHITGGGLVDNVVRVVPQGL